MLLLVEFKLALWVLGPWIPTSMFGIHGCTGKTGLLAQGLQLKLQLDHLVKLLHFPK